MSQENVEVIRAIHDEWLRGGLALDKFDPEMAMLESKALPGAASVYGIDAVQKYMESFANYWDEIRFEPQVYIEAGEQVVVIAQLVGRGKSSGIEVTRTWAYVWTLRGHRALCMEGYTNRDEALKAVGMAD
jgi:ketosteroid isomerase-like protein